MTEDEIRDPDLRHVGTALRRAALAARKLAEQTNTPFYVYENGKIIDLLEEERKSKIALTQTTHQSKLQDDGFPETPSSRRCRNHGLHFPVRLQRAFRAASRPGIHSAVGGTD